MRLRLDGVELGGRDARLLEPRPVGRDRVARLPGGDLLVGPVLAGVGPRVAAVAVGERLDERRAVARPCPVDGRLAGQVDRVDVVPVDDDRLEAVGATPGPRPDAPPRSRRRSAVYSMYWLFSQTNTTGAFQTAAMFSASWNAPMFVVPSPKKQTATWPGLAVLRGPGRAEGDRQVGADDRVRAHRAVLDAGQVHRAALAAEQARRPPEQLGEDRRHRHAPGQRVVVAAVRAERVVVGRASPPRRRPRPPPGRRRGGSCRARAPRRRAPGRGPRSTGTRPSSGTSGAGSRGRCRRGRGRHRQAPSTRSRRTARRRGSG